MDWQIIFQPENLIQYWEGIQTTLYLLIMSLLIGGGLAFLMALALTSRVLPLRWLVSIFTTVMRGTPLLLQTYLIYYGLSQFEWILERWDTVWPWVYFKEAMFCAVLSFSLNTAAYTAEMLAGAIRETGAGEIEAAQAYGMSRWTIMRRIVLPSAMRRTLPAYSNEVVMMLHSTSVASTLPSIIDITGAASSIYSTYSLPFEAFIAAAVIYLIATFSLVGMFRMCEKHFLAYMAPRQAN